MTSTTYSTPDELLRKSIQIFVARCTRTDALAYTDPVFVDTAMMRRGPILGDVKPREMNISLDAC